MLRNTRIRYSIEEIMNDMYKQKIIRARNSSVRPHIQTIGNLHIQIARKHNINQQSNIEICRDLTEKFAEQNIDVVIGGSIAMMTITPPRFTNDIDINIRANEEDPLSEERLHKIVSTIPNIDLKTFTYKSTSNPLAITSSFEYEKVPIDVFVYAEGEARKRVFERPLTGGIIKFAPVECLCFWKMLCGEESDKHFKDRADVVSMLKCAEQIDIDWVFWNLSEHNSERGQEWLMLVNKHYNSVF